jgi:hypothetical protein
MGEDTVERLLEELREMAGKLPDNRKAGNRLKSVKFYGSSLALIMYGPLPVVRF